MQDSDKARNTPGWLMLMTLMLLLLLLLLLSMALVAKVVVTPEKEGLRVVAETRLMLSEADRGRPRGERIDETPTPPQNDDTPTSSMDDCCFFFFFLAASVVAVMCCICWVFPSHLRAV